MRELFLLLAVAAVFPTATLAQKPGLEGFDEFASQTLKDWQVTGAALAVVKDGQVVHLKGYGLRNIKQSLPVTPDTLFAIGSITKSFTVTVLGTLADEGKIDWDRPVREYAPDFRLFDNAATDRETLNALAGEYVLATQTITVSVAGGERLLFGVSGQSARELAPARGLRFNIREQNGFSVEFRKDASGVVTEAVLHQPNGTFIARRK